MQSPPTLTIVIPALNEEATIAAAVASARCPGPGLARPRVVVVDGGSADGTVRVARRAGAEVRALGVECVEVIVSERVCV